MVGLLALVACNLGSNRTPYLVTLTPAATGGPALTDSPLGTVTETEAPSGRIDLTFAGGGTVRLDVEVLEARLADLGAAWAAKQKPEHAL